MNSKVNQAINHVNWELDFERVTLEEYLAAREIVEISRRAYHISAAMLLPNRVENFLHDINEALLRYDAAKAGEATPQDERCDCPGFHTGVCKRRSDHE